MLNGYWTFPNHINRAEVRDFGQALEHWGDKPLLVVQGIEFHPFGPGATPDALCRYCWSPNLHTSTHCEKCGAPLIHQGTP